MGYNASLLLSDLKSEIQPMLSSVTYETWFEPLKAITVEDDKVLILETSTPLADFFRRKDIRQNSRYFRPAPIPNRLPDR